MAFSAIVEREGLGAVVAVRRAAELPVHIQLHGYLVGAALGLEYFGVADGAFIPLFMARVREPDGAYPDLAPARTLQVDYDIARRAYRCNR